MSESNSVLLELVHALSGWEIRNFRTWLESPCHNQRKELIRLFDFLVQHIKHKKAINVEVELQAVFGTSDVKLLPKLRHEKTALTQLLRSFLIQQELEAQPVQQNLFLLKALRKRGLEKNFKATVRDTDKIVQKAENQSFAKQLDEFRFGMERYEYALQSKRGVEFPLLDLRQYLDAFYAGQVLHLACSAQAQKSVNAKEQERANLPLSYAPLLENLVGTPHTRLPEVAMYHLGQKMLSNPEDATQMKAFLDLLEQQIEIVPRTEGRNLLMLAINHGIRRINAGERAAISRTREFYLLGLKKKLLYTEQGHLPRYTYNNVLMTYLALEEWEKAAFFLEKYKLSLAEKQRENIYKYNLSIFHFRQGHFDTTLELLRDVRFSDPMYNLESRKMLLKIYFEQESFDALESLLDNLLTWLRRHGEIGYHRAMYRNLAIYTKRLLRLRQNDREGRARLKKKVEDTPLVAERKWLLGKIGL